jgi:ketosteroid isomerase-like protein
MPIRHSQKLFGLAAVLLLPLGLYLLDAGVSVPTSDSAEEEAIVSTLEAVFAATEQSDYDALDTLYAGADLTIIEGAGIDRGWVNYRDHHLKPELEEFQGFVYRPYEIEAHAEGDLAWVIFRYDLEIQLDERTVDNVGRGTAVLEKRDGRWVVRHMQTASRARR